MKNASVNQVNAGLVLNQAKMIGLDFAGAVHFARTTSLEPDACRATVVRLLKTMWTSRETKTAESQLNEQRQKDYDEKVRRHNPTKWDAACAMVGNDKREAKRLLRRAYEQSMAHCNMTGEELTAAREEIGWPRAVLARRLGIAPQHVDRWEWGRRPVPKDVAEFVTAVRQAVVSVQYGKKQETEAAPSVNRVDDVQALSSEDIVALRDLLSKLLSALPS